MDNDQFDTSVLREKTNQAEYALSEQSKGVYGIPQLVTTKSDKDTAEELKEKAKEHLFRYCTFLDECKEKGFEVNSNIGPNWEGKNVIQMLKIYKVY